jgi:hypothetical protein
MTRSSYGPGSDDKETGMDTSRTADRASRMQQLADLLRQTAEEHHQAFQATDGVDPEWPIWYAGHLLEHGFGELLEAKLLKSDLIYLLVLVEKAQAAEAPGGQWERYYADVFVSRYLK